MEGFAYASASGALAAACGLLALAAPAAQARDCDGSLPAKVKVLSRYSERYALQYEEKAPVYVETRGPRINNVVVQIYTFDGFKLGESEQLGDFDVGITGKVELRFPMQAGKYTVVVTGTVAGCPGYQQLFKIVRFKGCRTKLPLAFPQKPRGSSSDYEGFLSIPLRTRGPAVRNLKGRLYGFDGGLFGKSSLKVLFGTAIMDNKLTQPLQPGGYTFVVSGLLDQPRQCGPKSAQVTMKFR